MRTCNVISANLEEDYVAANTLIELEEEASAMAACQDEPGPTGTRSDKTYLKDYSIFFAKTGNFSLPLNREKFQIIKISLFLFRLQ